jgi:cytochrome c oxidase assembly protein subunit 11
MKLTSLIAHNRSMLGKLVVVVGVMFGFGYALVPLYSSICEALGINVLSAAEQRVSSGSWSSQKAKPNTQIDTSRTVVVEFDANARGPWDFKPAKSSVTVHPGEMTTVMYEFRNKQNRTMVAQAIPSFAPMVAGSHFNKVACFCFNEWTLKPGESKSWPVVFVVDAKLPKDVTTITLSYTFFEVGGKTPAAPVASLTAKAAGV